MITIKDYILRYTKLRNTVVGINYTALAAWFYFEESPYTEYLDPTKMLGNIKAATNPDYTEMTIPEVFAATASVITGKSFISREETGEPLAGKVYLAAMITNNEDKGVPVITVNPLTGVEQQLISDCATNAHFGVYSTNFGYIALGNGISSISEDKIVSSNLYVLEEL